MNYKAKCEKLEELVKNLTNQLITPEPTTFKADAELIALREREYKLRNKLAELNKHPKDEYKRAEEIPQSFKTLFNCLQDVCYEINFYGNDGNDNQEKVDGKELLIKWIKEAYNDCILEFGKGELPSKDEIYNESKNHAAPTGKVVQIG